MFRLLYKIFLTVNSLMIFLVVYFVKAHIWIPRVGSCSILIYIALPVIMSAVCLKFSDFLSHDSIEKVSNIESGSESYMSVYLGYFFIAAGIPDNDWLTLTFTFILIFLFVFFSQSQYFNPLFLLLGYKLYGITRPDGTKIFIISRRRIVTVKGLTFDDLRRINDFTFIDKEH